MVQRETPEHVVDDRLRHADVLQLVPHADEPLDHGSALWKLYVNTNDIEALNRRALGEASAPSLPVTKISASALSTRTTPRISSFVSSETPGF